ncbi:DUF5368 family protein [Wenzhouxiangella sp. AB-CW3]|uniref:DUF5368 family protein n=1 Tax=Wenzhouxiangella sp. AB-CW3 TaxID=2771012 RepID=UPI00168AE9F1|nr:DUF5368 family protein [Wenzhouxiangella sp. AB-CW3]QOC23931.1 DUF5368 family protein [Wenzhouxiangella sp. AB-CW3]
MAFSFFGILAVLLEFIRPFLPLILAVIMIELVLLVIALRKNGLLNSLRAFRSALPIGVVGFFVGILTIPWITGAERSNLAGVIDWLSLFGASFLLGLVALLLVWPPLALFSRSQA